MCSNCLLGKKSPAAGAVHAAFDGGAGRGQGRKTARGVGDVAITMLNFLPRCARPGRQHATGAIDARRRGHACKLPGTQGLLDFVLRLFSAALGHNGLMPVNDLRQSSRQVLRHVLSHPQMQAMGQTHLS